jgi:hypothetical protein
MRPKYLLPETVAREDGVGVEMVCENTMIQLTLGITRIITQESLEVSLWGSRDGKQWQFLTAFPQKFYCGTYLTLVDLARHPDVRYVRARWKVSRLNREESAPLFEFYLRAEEAHVHHAGAA